MTEAEPMAGAAGNPRLIDIIRGEITRAGGRITFAHFMGLALYHPGHGYYVTPERRPGRGGDFLTAPETTPFFGITLARWVAGAWERLGRPDPFTVREYGAGVGGLAYDIIAGLSQYHPEVRPALRYRLVEPNTYRLEQAERAMAEVGLSDVVSGEVPGPAGEVEPITGVVIANEVADALPVHRLVVREGRFREGYVGWREEDGGSFIEIEGEPSAPELGQPLWDQLAAQGVTLADGDRIEVSPEAERWFGEVARGLAAGEALVIDYGYAAAELYRGHRLGGMVRAYAGHTVGDDPFVRVGEQDLTAHVDFSALAAAGEAEGLRLVQLTNQALFLESLGLGQVLLDLQADPEMTTDAYLAHRATIFRLIDPGGMGRFGALVMRRTS